MDQLNKKPLYLQVADLLARKIAAEDWIAGQALPNEYDLALQLHISIGTLRKAVDTLVQNRLLSRRQGKGTFVVDRRATEIRNVFEPSRHADGRRIEWDWQGINAETSACSADESKFLRLSQGDRVIRLTRLGFIGKRRACCAHAVLPEAIYGDISDIGDQDRTTVGLAHARKILLKGVDDLVDVHAVNADTAALLGVREGFRVMRLRRTSWDQSDRPVDFRVFEYNFDGEYYAPATSISHGGGMLGRGVAI